MMPPNITPIVPFSPRPARVPAESFLAHWWVRWGLIFAAWTLIGLIESGQGFMLQSLYGKSIPRWKSVVMGVADWYIWAALTPFLLWGLRHFPIEQRNWPRRLMLHAAIGFACSMLVIILFVPLLDVIHSDYDYIIMPAPSSTADVVARLLGFRLLIYMVVYWVIVGITQALAYYRKYREREMQAVVLESQLTQAQLQVLKMQLQPHFLFNTLNAISALMHQDVELADQMLARLADLLRSTLETSGTQEVPLKQELEFVELYLEIEQARFGPRLVVSQDAEPETMDAFVPNLILQPLVENAIRHGIAPRPENGHIEIRTRRVGDLLQVQVIDDGPGLPKAPAGKLREGVGLANTRARLRQLYGDAHQFILADRPEGGLAVTLRLPFRECPDEAQGEPEGNGRGGYRADGPSFGTVAASRSL
jgi:two-component sensor histidine kinase